ncbi:hypothetical protein ABPG75_012441 [Micractinium tetrahymenae]
MVQAQRLLLLAACVAGVLLLLPAAAAPRCKERRRNAREEVVCAEALDASLPVPQTAKAPKQLAANASFSNVVLHTRVDDYAWLRDDYRNVTAVLSHLQEENAYAEAVMAPSRPLQQRLKEEMLGRIPQEEASVPQRHGRHWYYSVHDKGRQYRRHCRRPLADPEAAPSEHDSMDLQQPEEVLLDEDQLAANRSYFDMAGPVVSSDEQLMAYAVDSGGGEVYTLFVRNLTSSTQLLDPESGDAYSEEFSQCAGDMAFLDDSRTLLFTTQTSDTHRPDKVWRVDAAAGPARARGGRRVYQAALMFHERDERFHLALWRSRSDATIFLRGSSETTHYLLYLPSNATGEGANFTMLAPPVQERELLVRDWHSSGSGEGTDEGGSSSGGGSFLYAVIYTAEQRNGQLVATRLAPGALAGATASAAGGAPAPAPAPAPGPPESGEPGDGGASGAGSSGFWAVLQAHSREVEIVDLTVSSRHLALLERRNGTLVATAYPLPPDGSPLRELPSGQHFSFEAPSYALWLGDQGPFASPLLRVRYSSLTQPLSTYDINMKTGNRVLKQQQEVTGFDHSKYLARLLWASSTSGAQVPISLAYRADLARLDGTDPLLLEAYGAYGSSYDPEFSGARLSLLDRGFVFAIAHVRGGGELGRYWYQDGKLLAKNHTFDDVIAAAEFLIQARYTSARRLALWGRSAGGLTAGASVNCRPDLFRAAILDVPFVDVVSTMSDPSLPLTVIEWEEWGDPLTDEAAYRNMLSYSPLDNVAAQPYPHLLLTAGLNDPRVSFWEPAKFAAKVRELKTSPDSLVLLRTNMAAGHFAQSGLEDRLAEMAFKYAFLVQTVAPCAGLPPAAQPEASCQGCFAIFVTAATTAALVTLAVVLRPASRLGRSWRRLGGTGQRRGLGSDEEEGDEEAEGYDTRLYAAHMSDAELHEEAAAEAQRQRRLRQQQLEEEGLSLTRYEDVRSAVRGQLQPIPASPLGPTCGGGGSGAAPASLPPRRLALGGTAAAAAGSVELAPLNGSAGRALSAIPESPTLSSSSLMSA